MTFFEGKELLINEFEIISSQTDRNTTRVMSEEVKGRVAKITSGRQFRRVKSKKQKTIDPSTAASDPRFSEMLKEDKRPPVDMFGREIEPGALAKWESSSDEEDDHVIPQEALPEESSGEEARTSDSTCRLAISNLSWKKFTADDIYAMIAKACEDRADELVSLTVYKSRWGQEHPPIEDTLPIDDIDEETKIAIWRKKEKEEMKRYFAIVVFKNVDIANLVYKNLNDVEIGDSGNYFDLSVVPDEQDFDEFPVRDVSTSTKDNWDMPNVEAPWNNSSKPKEEWDAMPEERRNAIRAAWEGDGSEDEIIAGVLMASSSEDEDKPRREDFGDILNALEEEDENEEEDDNGSDEMPNFDIDFVENNDEGEQPEDEQSEEDTKGKKMKRKKEKKEKKAAQEVTGDDVNDVLKDERFAKFYEKPGYGVNAADPNFKRSSAMDKFMAGVAKKHQESAGFGKKK